MSEGVQIVTGAFGYIGRYIAAKLIKDGHHVMTITTHVDKPNPFGDSIRAYPYSFENPDQLTETLRGARTLYNTYWIRFETRGQTFEQAVSNTAILFECAARAGVEKIVHISVTNASVDSALPYYAGKGRQEELLKNSSINYAIVRPTLVFGDQDILVNNIAWLIRRFPVFPILADGSYSMQPIYAGDLANVAVDAGEHVGPLIVDAVGPEKFTYSAFVKTIASAVEKEVHFVNTPPWLGLLLGQLIGLYVRDVILTRDEYTGLRSNLLTSGQLPNGATRFTEWIGKKGQEVGLVYTSELGRHFRWKIGN